ncbi:MAG: helix-turn-helix domain-containing protein [Opitutae bacterium]|nr:helix-turn-helix domain-containing protein [Opitutae bacterium]
MKAGARNIIRTALDQQTSVMQDARTSIRRPGWGWLQSVREAIGLKQTEVAKAIGVTRQSYAQLERAEANRSISLKSLDRAAEAMDCEVVYFLVPKETAGRTFAELAQIHDPMFKHLRKTEHSMSLEGQAVGDLKKRKP